MKRFIAIAFMCSAIHAHPTKKEDAPQMPSNILENNIRLGDERYNTLNQVIDYNSFEIPVQNSKKFKKLCKAVKNRK